MKQKTSPKTMWTPDRGLTRMDEFRDIINKKFTLNLEKYEDLWKWSTENIASFWEEVLHFCNFKLDSPYTSVVDENLLVQDIPKWFDGATFNFAEHLLRGDNEKVAIIESGEGGKCLQKVTFCQLRNRVAILASALRHCGVQKDDRVVGYIPNCSFAVEAMLAAASLGAVWSSTSPDFGVSGVLDRFTQIKPKVIFSVEAVIYNEKVHNHLDKLAAVVKGLPFLEKVIILPYIKAKVDVDIKHIPNSIFLDKFQALSDEKPCLQFVPVPFSHPLFIMYSSGTTGEPKCMVHSAGGTLIQHLKEHVLHGNMTDNDVIMYYSTTGWMMWNWLVSALAVGATIVLYDGSPFKPNPYVLWDLVENIGITILGTSAKWLQALEERKIHLIESHPMPTLHTILSTGSPLMPASFDYVYKSIKKNLLLGSITGGTDIISCFAGQNPTLPVHQGEIQSRNLGMAIESWNDEGQPTFDCSGELVCTKPFPSMPVFFWNDADGVKYRKAYFDKFEGVWSHGDFCLINSITGGITMLGRSDGTLNPNGVRFGSAEIYNLVETIEFPEIADSLCVAQNTDMGERVVLFLNMADGYELDTDLLTRIKSKISKNLSPRHVPAVILTTKDIPYTTNGKKVEVAVKRILSGETITKRGALRNPESLDLYYNITELGQNITPR